MDIWVRPSSGNDVFTFGRPPMSIEILTKVKGLEFDLAFENATWYDILPGFRVRVLAYADLISAKKAANRPKDLDDLENLIDKN